MGTVNIFKFNEQRQINEKPEKSILNLTTSITDLKFHPSSNLLAICSKWKKNAVRMVHIPTCSVYQNFPGAAVGILKYPFCLDFDHSGKFMAMGNDEGKVHLWNLQNF